MKVEIAIPLLVFLAAVLTSYSGESSIGCGEPSSDTILLQVGTFEWALHHMKQGEIMTPLPDHGGVRYFVSKNGILGQTSHNDWKSIQCCNFTGSWFLACISNQTIDYRL